MGPFDVVSKVSNVIEPHEDVNKAGRVDEGTGVSLELCVVKGAVDYSFDLLHVGLPVYLGVWRRKHELHYYLLRTAEIMKVLTWNTLDDQVVDK